MTEDDEFGTAVALSGPLVNVGARFFATGGYAFHGAYWHQNYGAPMSRGCVNMRPEDSRWLFRWTNPVWDPLGVADETDWEARGQGTRVEVVS